MNPQIQAIQDAILDHGHAIQHHVGDVYPSYAYTVGLTMQGLPELCISGPFTPEHAAQILNELAGRMDAATEHPGAFESDALGISLHSHHVELVTPERFPSLVATFGRARLIQLLWPDDNGRYPNRLTRMAGQQVFA